MARCEFLGGFELLDLSSLMRLGEEAYGVSIAETIGASSGPAVALGTGYMTHGSNAKGSSLRASASRRLRVAVARVMSPAAVAFPQGRNLVDGQEGATNV